MRLVGTLVIAMLLAACTSSRAAPPKWPKQTERETDGGESLAPRKVVAEAPDKAKDKADDDADADAAEPAEAAKDAAAAKDADAKPEPEPEAPVAPPDEEIPITTEEIVIEIEEEE